MSDAILARLAEIEHRAEHRAELIHHKVDSLNRALLHLAKHIVEQGNRMSATTGTMPSTLAMVAAAAGSPSAPAPTADISDHSSAA